MNSKKEADLSPEYKNLYDLVGLKMKELMYNLKKDMSSQINNVEKNVIKKLQETSNLEHDS